MYTLYIGNKNYSSWSLRGWSCCEALGAPFARANHALRARTLRNESASSRRRAACRACTMARRRLGFARDRRVSRRAASRHVARRRRGARLGALGRRAEMHSGFGELRNELTMYLRIAANVQTLAGGRRDIARIAEIWSEGRERFGRSGRFPVGAFRLADVFYARSRFASHLRRRARTAQRPRIIGALLAHPAMREWGRRARARPSIVRCSTARWRRRSSNDSAGRRMSDLVAAWRDRVRAAAAATTPLRIGGGGTKDFYGQALAGEVLDTSALRGHRRLRSDRARHHRALRHAARRHRADDARRSGQMLAFEPPHFGERRPSAARRRRACPDRAGPTRARCAISSWACGSSTARATICAFGGRVMKNVAGFDVSRLMAGSLGTLGVILEVSLKCLPLPKAETTRIFECSADEAMRMTQRMGAASRCRCRRPAGTRDGSRATFRRRSRSRSGRGAAIGRRAAARTTRRRILGSVREQTHAFFRSRRMRRDRVRGAVASLGARDRTAHGSRRRRS